jgi:Fe-S cluster assembly protein SufD
MTAPGNAVSSRVLERVLHEYQAVAASLPGDARARAGRARAAGQLADMGWPSTRDEHWRYANLRAFEHPGAYRPAFGAPADPAATLTALQRSGTLPPPVPGFERLLYVDGVQVGGERSVHQVSAEEPGGDWTWPPELRLGLLCDMFASDAARLHVRGSAAIEVLFITSPLAARAAVYPRLHLQLAADSGLQLIERHLGDAPEATLIAANITLALGRGSSLRHYRLQQYGRQVAFTDTLWAQLAEAARYTACSMTFGAGTARTSARVQLAGRGASVAWQAIAAARADQVLDTALRVEHTAADTRTDEVFRGIADERARLAFSGHIQIAAAATGSQARQSLRGLIEGAGAEIDLQPRLEINTDEVRASHGATTGRLDDNLLFYLLARGIDPERARGLLKWAFLGDVLREIDVPVLRAEAEHVAAGQLPDVAALGALA